mmetsp:Transcript_2536/g.5554  ORF Transcript_2536/g.5554 Transcript_2536/m.5554 type:complete len:179 (+) Transcript_2536:430-966(+)
MGTTTLLDSLPAEAGLEAEACELAPPWGPVCSIGEVMPPKVGVGGAGCTPLADAGLELARELAAADGTAGWHDCACNVAPHCVANSGGSAQAADQWAPGRASQGKVGIPMWAREWLPLGAATMALPPKPGSLAGVGVDDRALTRGMLTEPACCITTGSVMKEDAAACSGINAVPARPA